MITISTEENKKVLQKLKEQMVETVIAWEVNIRHGERLKVTARAGEIAKLEEAINNAKNIKEENEKKIEVIEDILKETK
jgi:hypothetical protein